MRNLFLLYFLYASVVCFAQKRYSLDELINYGLNHNAYLKVVALDIEKNVVEKKAAYGFEKTAINYSYGEINSRYIDHGISVSQEFEFPLVYTRRGQLQNTRIERSQVSKALVERELIREIKLQYNEIVALKNQIYFYEKVDEILGHAEEVAMEHPRHDLESELMQAKHVEIELMISQLKADIIIAKYALKALVFTEQLPYVLDSLLSRNHIVFVDSLNLNNHPVVGLSKVDVLAAAKELSVMKAEAAPDIYLEYFNNQMDGVKGFQGMVAGVAIPLVWGTQRGQMQGVQVAMDIEQMNLENVLMTLNASYNQDVQEYKKNLLLLEVYENSAEKTSAHLMSLSIERYENDMIGYIEFSRDLEEAVDLHLRYLQTLKDYNASVIQLAYYY